jgi:hypothetical protein
VTVSNATNVTQAIAGSDDTISVTELQRAIQYWSTGQAVPGTNGKAIGVTKIRELIRIWANGGAI